MQVNKWEKPFHVERGDIYIADLGTADDIIGSEQYGVRPVIATQSNVLNRKSPTVIVAVVTSELKKTWMDTHVVLPDLKGLPRKSMVATEQRFTIDKQRLLKYCCTVPVQVMDEVTRACRKAEQADKKFCRKK